ncbi:MAG: TetR/AcrR family transcriptional regulator [Alphaproteobacteria bacterium]|nr:TetR/AcrR family transcriptional regulator [Alphaproteobacteria bacterium]
MTFPDSTEKTRCGRPKDSVKRDEIVAAATQLFLDNGFELTSMEAVARQAGVSKLTIYSHFADKNELFHAIMQTRCVRLGMPESFMAFADRPVVDALTQIAGSVAAIVFHEDSIRLQRLIYAGVQRHPDIVKTFYETGPKRVRAAFADLLREFDAQGVLAVPDAARATEQFFSLIKGERLLRTLMGIIPLPTPEELAIHVRASVALFVAAYHPEHPASMESS